MGKVDSAIDTMNALTRAQGLVSLERRPCPVPPPEHVLVRVRTAGVCRTDLQVARGELSSADPVVLGHEFSGEICELGSPHPDFKIGQHVSAIPWHLGSMLGVQQDGAFSSHVLLHASQVIALPPDMPWRHGAYVEPVAAALGAVITPLPFGMVHVLGEGRIAQLTARVLACLAPETTISIGLDGPEASFDLVVETLPKADILQRALRLVRPGGRVVLKSRADVNLQLPLKLAISRHASIHPVGHGSFTDAVDLLHSGALQIDDLLSDPRPLREWRRAFEESEARKVFLIPDP